MSSGSRFRITGSTNLAKCGLGSHPAGMNNAVSSPQAMNAPTLGTTIPARKAPKLLKMRSHRQAPAISPME